jgi:16S rRNA (cytosine1402-N4)-methyltransferase
MHTPVLLQKAVAGLKVKPGNLYIDATVGEGGHLKEILKEGGKILAIDWDQQQISKLKSELKQTGNVSFAVGNFSDIESIAKQNNFYPVSGILIDLGLSLGQIRESKRGFSFKNLEEPLDMRISSDLKYTASDIINSFSEQELYEVLAGNAEEVNSRPIVEAIVRARTLKPVEKVSQLLSVIDQVLGHKDAKTYARVFQALRITVNNEFNNLRNGLNSAMNVLSQEGRLVVITFHSLEDRIVKRFITENNLRQINHKVIKGSREKSFERSAQLRIIEK